MKTFSLILLLFLLALSSCTVVTTSRQETQMTQTQIREFQTRYFDTNDVKLVMKSVLNVLQDDGYIVKNAVVDLGLVTASKEIDLSNPSRQKDDFWEQFFLSLANANNNSNQREVYKKIRQIEVSINVSEYGRQTKVRANFQARELDNTGNVIKVYSVDDAKFYQDFFSKVDKGVFLQKQGL
ncbi:MAG TPA: hypothetical protein PL149_00030 [Candidatus Kapabacteria bacterium]|jgi:hypothetical protein|nr:hypothetical protein [Candidatus Kapabacteria bacterium]